MTSAERIVEVCRTALEPGPMGKHARKPFYQKFVACGFDQDLSGVATSCAVFVRAVLHWAGRRATRPGRIGQGVNGGWLEGMGFSHPAWQWAHDPKLGVKNRPTPGCIFARDFSKATSAMFHVGVLVDEIADDVWRTAEGGGANGGGTECRLSKPEGKYIWTPDSLGRQLLGWWRPELLSMGSEFAEGWEELANEVAGIANPRLFCFPGIERTTPEFRRELCAMADRLTVDPNAIAAVMSIESGFRPDAQNPHRDKNGESAVGLIQFMPFLLRKWGYEPAAVAKMSAVEQLALVERFYKKQNDDDPGTLYMLTFMPACAFFPDNYVLGQQGSEATLFGLSMHQIYRQNAGLDRDKDGDIEVGEVKKLARDRYELGKRRGLYQPNANVKLSLPVLRLEATGEFVRRVQRVVGTKADGVFGPLTETAVRKFQRAHGLAADGVVGAKTWTVIEEVEK